MTARWLSEDVSNNTRDEKDEIQGCVGDRVHGTTRASGELRGRARRHGEAASNSHVTLSSELVSLLEALSQVVPGQQEVEVALKGRVCVPAGHVCMGARVGCISMRARVCTPLCAGACVWGGWGDKTMADTCASQGCPPRAHRSTEEEPRPLGT